MGWKSTTYIKREEAKKLILCYVDMLTDEELADTLESMGFGDNMELPYHGYNFIIGEEQ